MSSISIYKNFQNLPQDIQQKLLEFEKLYKSLEDLPKIFVKDTPTFIFKAMFIYNNRYNYHKVNYIHSLKKVIIECREHGDFEQKPSDHLSGYSCPKCAGNSKSNLEEFIEKAKIVHKDIQYQYTYDKFVYVNARTKSTITCEKHGDFEQAPANHLKGHGCPECAIENRRSNLEEFIERAKFVHKDSLYKYTYELFVYRGVDIKGIITCQKHGDFEQIPAKHLSGQGCPECKKERQRELNGIRWQDRYSEGILYLIECWNDVERFIKIGVTSKTVEERYRNSILMPYNYKVLEEIPLDSKSCIEYEQHILEISESYKPKIHFDGIKECLSIDEKYYLQDILENLKKNNL